MRAEWAGLGVALRRELGPARAMGAKYLPTVKDMKATQRFQQKQNALPVFKKSSPKAKGGKKK